MGKAGTLAKLRKTHWEAAPPEPGAGVTPLDVENVGGMFVMLIAGTALGFVIGLTEFFYGVCREKKEDETICGKLGKDCKLAASCASMGDMRRYKSAWFDCDAVAVMDLVGFNVNIFIDSCVKLALSLKAFF